MPELIKSKEREKVLDRYFSYLDIEQNCFILT